MALATPSVDAQPAAASAPQAPVNPVDPASIQALKDMGAHLQTLKRFQVMTDVTGERVLADGQKLQHAASATLDVVRPNKMRARMVSARSERELVYDGKTVVLFTPAQKVYSSVEVADTLGGLIDRLQNKVRHRDATVRPVRVGNAVGAVRQDRVGDECRPGLHR